ncbi:hypothetical protein FBQ81_03305 [Chloroflexi bacterium CFX6]|nr:hypothetical protein [Chloroflexi bacterium CFX6]
MSVELSISLLSAFTVLVLGLLQWSNSSRAQKVDAHQKIGEAYARLLEELSKHVNELEERVKELEKDLRKYRNWSAKLVKQLIENGIVPTSPPDTGELNRGDV